MMASASASRGCSSTEEATTEEGGGCHICAEDFDQDQKTTNCSLCRVRMHVLCFADNPKPPRKSRNSRKDDTDATEAIIHATLESHCVLVICKTCQAKADVPGLLQKLHEASTKNAIKTEKLDDKTTKLDATVTRLEADLTAVRRELNLLAKLPQPQAIEDGLVQLEALSNKMKTQEDLPEKLTDAIATVQNLEASWATVASKKQSLPVADIDQQVHERMRK